MLQPRPWRGRAPTSRARHPARWAHLWVPPTTTTAPWDGSLTIVPPSWWSRSAPSRGSSDRSGAPAAAGPGSRSSGPARRRCCRSRGPSRWARTRSHRPEGVVLAVELALDLAGEEDVRLLERVVVGLGRAAQLVVHREHRHVVRTELRGRRASSRRCRCRRPARCREPAEARPRASSLMRSVSSCGPVPS